MIDWVMGRDGVGTGPMLGWGWGQLGWAPGMAKHGGDGGDAGDGKDVTDEVGRSERYAEEIS